MACFVSYLIYERKVLAATANGYVSHVIHHLTASRAIPANDAIRSSFLAMVIRGHENLQAVTKPLRLRVRIPLHFALLTDALRIIDERCAHLPLARLQLRAAFALGYGLSLRPGEYLADPSRPTPLHKQANSSNLFLWWADTDFSVCFPSRFPPTPPSRVSLRLDHLKNDRLGKGGPRSFAANPDPSAQVCCVRIVWEYFRACHTPPNSPALYNSAIGHQATRASITSVLNVLAHIHGLDPKRLVPHSIRYGAIQGMLANDIGRESRQFQGGWTSAEGVIHYEQAFLAHGDRVAHAIHDDTSIPVSHIRHMSADTDAASSGTGCARFGLV